MSEINKERKNRVLCVDDEPTNRLIIESTLEKYYDIISVGSGRAALEFLAEKTVNLILLDIIMPDIDGYEVIKRIKNDEKLKQIPVIFLTGMKSPGDIKKGLELGCNDYLAKPFNAIELKARVDMQINLADAQKILLNYERVQTVKSMVTSLHHEINNPLTVLTSMTEFFRKKIDGYDTEFHMMNKAMERIEIVIDKMRHLEEVHFLRYSGQTDSKMIKLPDDNSK